MGTVAAQEVEATLWNIATDIKWVLAVAQLMGSEREVLERARAIVLDLKALEEEKR